jgi:hypothetical protein
MSAPALNRMPTNAESLTAKGSITRGWYAFWTGLYQGQPTQTVAVVTPGTSPFTYIAPIGGTLIVQGGTVSAISFSRDAASFYPVGVTNGMLLLSKGDQLVITYSVPPNLVWVPR